MTLLGIGGVIGTGIFVLTAEATQKAGPGMMLSFIIAGAVSAVAALCWPPELASMVPVSGSAYTYSYAVLGELVAWMVRPCADPGICRRRQRGIGRLVGLLSLALRAHLPDPIIIPPALAAGPMPAAFSICWRLWSRWR